MRSMTYWSRHSLRRLACSQSSRCANVNVHLYIQVRSLSHRVEMCEESRILYDQISDYLCSYVDGQLIDDRLILLQGSELYYK